MNAVIVGQLGGAPKVRWRTALLCAAGLGVFGAAIAAITYFALAGQFSWLAAIVGFFGPSITVGAAIQQALNEPLENLTPLDRLA